MDIASRIRRAGLAVLLLAPLSLTPARPVRAAEDVAIGVIYPLTGNSAQVGIDARAALMTEAEIINGQHNVAMQLGAGGGLPHLGGAHIRLVFADSQNSPQTARAEAERLITQEHVAAIVGSYTSATAVTISQVTERYQIPYISADNSSPTLTQRGLHWFFRTSPTDVMFTGAMFDFFKAIGQQTGRQVHSVALIHEDSIFGSDSATVQRQDAEAAGIKVTADIRYRANSPSLSTEVERLHAADADVVMPSSYTSDAILLMREMHETGYTPKALLAQDAGFVQQSFLDAVGPLAEGVMSRSAFALDATKSRPAIVPVNAMFHAQTGKDLNDLTSREITALQVLADAIDRAGSTEPEAIRMALVATHIPGDQTIMPWRGVAFDTTGQNTEADPVIQQIQGGGWRTVFPFDVAAAPAIWNVGK
jgi:branched-chain amino acid transport system substrate-binding protein